jgi:hypothetical protein
MEVFSYRGRRGNDISVLVTELKDIIDIPHIYNFRLWSWLHIVHAP